MLAPTLLLAFLTLVVFWLARRRLEDLPRGRLISIDLTTLPRLRETLYDPVLDLAGRPDILIRQRGEVIPVELKSSTAPESPYASHLLQLAAYMALVEATQGVRPSHGILKYSDQTFEISNTKGLQVELSTELNNMRSHQHTPERSHESAARCRACLYRLHCDRALG